MKPAFRAVRNACVLAFMAAAGVPTAMANPPAPADTASAIEPDPAANANAFDLAADPDYANYRQAVVDYLVARHARSDAHGCVLGERDSNGGRTATVWWREGARIIAWEGRDSKLSTSVSNLDLKRDVVASEDELHGSTYLVTRQWVADFKARCTRWGTSFVVRRRELDAARKPLH